MRAILKVEPLDPRIVPAPVPDTFTVHKELRDSVAKNDTNVTPLTHFQVTDQDALNGGMSFNATTGAFTFRPNPGIWGAQFSYRSQEGNGPWSESVYVDIAVTNERPEGVRDRINLVWEGTGAISVLANDYDLDGDKLTVSGIYYYPQMSTVLDWGPTKKFTIRSDVGQEVEPDWGNRDGFGYYLYDGYEEVPVWVDIYDYARPKVIGFDKSQAKTQVTVIFDQPIFANPTAATVLIFNAAGAKPPCTYEWTNYYVGGPGSAFDHAELVIRYDPLPPGQWSARVLPPAVGLWDAPDIKALAWTQQFTVS